MRGVVQRVWRYAFRDLLDETSHWLVLGILLSGLLAAALPDWLAAGMDPRRVAGALEEHVPELHDGRLRLRACTPDLLRAKDDEWHARYTLTVATPAGESREVVLVGNLWQPGRERPAPGPG